MNADEWLKTVFEPCLDRESLAFGNDGDLLRGQLRALRDCEVLSAQACTDAEARLDAAMAVARKHARFRVHPAGTTQPPPRTTTFLRRVLAIGRPVAEVDGMTFMLTSVELWSDRTYLFLAGVNTLDAQRRIEKHEEQVNEWGRKHRAGHSGEGVLSPPVSRGNRLYELNIRLRDSTGNTYRARGGSAGGSGTEWRLRSQYQPGIPLAATRLAVEIPDPQGQTIADLELPL